jgi:hypothetical protein
VKIVDGVFHEHCRNSRRDYLAEDFAIHKRMSFLRRGPPGGVLSGLIPPNQTALGPVKVSSRFSGAHPMFFAERN